MGLLSKGTPLSWEQSKVYHDYIKKHGILQFLNIYRTASSRENDIFLWGDEVEHMLVTVDPTTNRARLSLRAPEILDQLEKLLSSQPPSSPPINAHFVPEYGRHMIEATPARPYGGYTSDLRMVEPNMRLRRRMVQALLHPNEFIMTLTSFPLMGVGHHTEPQCVPFGPIAQSLYISDSVIGPHPRFATLSRNIRIRRGSKVCIRVPLYQDTNTRLHLEAQMARRGLRLMEERKEERKEEGRTEAPNAVSPSAQPVSAPSPLLSRPMSNAPSITSATNLTSDGDEAYPPLPDCNCLPAIDEMKEIHMDAMAFGMGACLSEDSRVLTNCGFLFLDEVKERVEELLFASYNPATEQLEYHPAIPHVHPVTGVKQYLTLRPHGRHSMVDFTQEAEQPAWLEDSDVYGRLTLGEDNEGSRRNHLSLLVTADHDMFVQRGKLGEEWVGSTISWSSSCEGQERTPVSHAKVRASQLVDSDHHSRIRMLSCATSGVALSAEVESAPLPFMAALGLKNEAQMTAFLELYGFWLGDGGMEYRANDSGYDAVAFHQAKRSDCEWLHRVLSAVGLQPHQLRRCVKSGGGERILITDRRWFVYFDSEYGRKYEQSSYYVTPAAKVGASQHLINQSLSSPPLIDLTEEESDVDQPQAKRAKGDPINLMEWTSPVERRPRHVASAKWFCPWVLTRLNRDQVRLVIEGYRRADGGWKTDCNEVFTSSVQLRDELCIAMLHAGYATHFELRNAAGSVRGYKPRHVKREGREKGRLLSSDDFKALSAAQQAHYSVVRTRANKWLVRYVDSGEVADSTGRIKEGNSATTPTLYSARDVRRVDDYFGRVWCVTVPTGLIVVQRAQRNSAGVVTKASRPTIVGNCCLQVTFQTRSIREARHLYDHLAVLSPIMLALSAATPFYRGRIADSDVRWSVISQAVDDRTNKERGLEDLEATELIRKASMADYEKPLDHPHNTEALSPRSRDRHPQRLHKSRYDSISSYLSLESDLDPAYNDIPCEQDRQSYDTLIAAGIDPLLAQHISHLFVRDPLVIYDESVIQDDEKSSDHFENLQSTNWQTVRFKPPPPHTSGPPMGWRVEFRTMEVQLTDFENAAFTVFVALISRAILFFSLNFYLPISKVDDNLHRAHSRDAIHSQQFHWRPVVKDCPPDDRPCGSSAPAAPFEPMSIAEIMTGKPSSSYPGLIPLVRTYLDMIHCDPQTLGVVNGYLDLLAQRATGQLLTAASWLRKFVEVHPDYQHDSQLRQSVVADLMRTVEQIQSGKIEVVQLMGKLRGVEGEEGGEEGEGGGVELKGAPRRLDLKDEVCCEEFRAFLKKHQKMECTEGEKGHEEVNAVKEGTEVN